MGEIAEIDPQEEWKLLVGGEWTSTAATYEVVDPNTTGVVGHAPDGSVADAEATIAARRLLAFSAALREVMSARTPWIADPPSASSMARR